MVTGTSGGWHRRDAGAALRKNRASTSEGFRRPEPRWARTVLAIRSSACGHRCGELLRRSASSCGYTIGDGSQRVIVIINWGLTPARAGPSKP